MTRPTTSHMAGLTVSMELLVVTKLQLSTSSGLAAGSGEWSAWSNTSFWASSWLIVQSVSS